MTSLKNRALTVLEMRSMEAMDVRAVIHWLSSHTTKNLSHCLITNRRTLREKFSKNATKNQKLECLESSMCLLLNLPM